MLDERSGGRIKIQVFPGARLGQEKDTIDQTQAVMIDLNRINMGPFNSLVPETFVPSLPFIFRDVAHMRSVMDGPIGDEILKAFEAHGFVGLAFYDSGARSFYNSKRPVEKVEDLKGMRVRVIQSDLFLDLAKALGANAVGMPIGDVHPALQAGALDGAENNWPSFDSFKHFEVAKYYSLTEHSMPPEILVMSKKNFDKLSAGDQKLVRTAAKESVAKMRELWEAREKMSEAAVRAAGVQINRVDKTAFVAAMKPVYERFVTTDKLREMVKRIQAQPGT
jgi:tripartite ATP-independent transporter DctP family solute receptor